MLEHESGGPRLIVVGVDGSGSSWRAAAYASGLARRQGSRLAIVYVQPVAALAIAAGLGWAMNQVTAEIATEIADRLRDELVGGRDALSPQWEFHTLLGGTASGLASTADQLRADLVVVGCAARRRHASLRSLAPRLIRLARWPVIVVP